MRVVDPVCCAARNDLRSSRRWGFREARTIRLNAVLTGIFAGYLFIYLCHIPEYHFGDFIAIWAYAKVLFTHPVGDLYDNAVLHAAEVGFGMDPAGEAPFPYAPTVLLMLWPLGLLSLVAAYGAWIVVTLALYICSIFTKGHAALAMATFALVAPTTTINIVVGQSGFLLAALLIGGLRLMDRRPILSGILFGLLTYKPQFGILVPIALMAAGQWRCIAAACVTTATLIVASVAVFGGTIWLTWLRAFPAYAAWFDDRIIGQSGRSTLTANLQSLGVAQEPARLIQAIAVGLAAVLVWFCFRRLPRALAIPALLVATSLATPHAFLYDLPMVTGAALLFVAYRLRSDMPFSLPEIGVLILVLIFPAIMAQSTTHVPISTVVLSLFEMLILSTGERQRTISTSAPLEMTALQVGI